MSELRAALSLSEDEFSVKVNRAGVPRYSGSAITL
jgi:hypothetical protein